MAKAVTRKEQSTVKLIDLSSYLDMTTLTRAERSYYEKQYSSHKGSELSVTQWKEIVKFIHQK